VSALSLSRPFQKTARIAIKRSSHTLKNVFDINFLAEFARPPPIRKLPRGVLWSIPQCVDGDLFESFFKRAFRAEQIAKRLKSLHKRLQCFFAGSVLGPIEFPGPPSDALVAGGP